MKKIILVSSLMLMKFNLHAQMKSISGYVIDSITNRPLTNVAIIINGRPSAVTNDSGRYLVNLVDNVTVKDIKVFKENYDTLYLKNFQLNDLIKLHLSSKLLNEVVVVGYGTQKKINLTGAVASVTMEDMKDRPLTNAGQALQGTVSGVYALQASGKPGDDGAVFSIRGVGTFGDNSPLVLVDGFPSSINAVNPNDIQSISVLKDAASSAIYGNRAANGVILITTKKGILGKMSVNLMTYFGMQSPTRLPKVLNSEQYTTLYNEASINSGGNAKYTDAQIQKYASHTDPMYPDINYFKVYYGDASMRNHRITVNGGTDRISYSVMFGNMNQNGILVGTGYEKSDFRSNVDAYLTKDKRLRVSTRLAGFLGVKQEPTDLWSTQWYATNAPIYPLKDTSGNWMSVNNERNYYGEVKEGSTTKKKTYNFSGQIETEYKIIKDLSAQVTYAYSVDISNKNAFHSNITLVNANGSTTNVVSDLTVTNETDVHTMLTSLLKYNKIFGRNNINILGGYSEEVFTWDWQSGYRSGFVNNSQRVLNLGDPSTQTNNAGSYDLGMKSFFGRVNYVLNEKYLLEANIRRDGSSRFYKGHQWGAFPSFSLGWILSKENFLSNIDWLKLMKIRASWGRLGNQNINNYYNGTPILSSGQNYSFGGSLASGVAITSMINENITWETAEQINLGLDLSVANGLELTVDYFDKRTKNLLMLQTIPLTSALSAPYANGGEVQNKGIEFLLSYKKRFDNGMQLRASVNASHMVNKIVDLNIAEQLNSPKAILKGAAINSFYGYKMDGIYQLSDFTWQNNSDASIAYADRTYSLKNGVTTVSNYSALPGDIKYKDINGDGVVDMNNDRTVIGKQFPDLNYGLNFNVSWHNVDLGVFFQGVQGIQGYTYYEIATPFSGVSNIGNWWLNRWTPTNPTNVLPRLTLDGVRNNIHSSFYVGNASYLRLKNIELGYSLSPKLLSKAGISSCRIYGNIQNAFTVTKFKGFDPEQTTDQTRAEAFPQVKIATIGFNVNF